MREPNGTARELRAFVDAHPHGWNHDDWLGFLHHLEQDGHDFSDPDGIGLALERERLRNTLKGCGVKGLGPKRIESVASVFPTLHELQEAEGPDVAARTGLPRKLAQELVRRIR